MERSFIIFFILFSIACFGQARKLDTEGKHRLLNDVIRDNFEDQTLDLDDLPCNNQLKISYGWIQQNFATINKELDQQELKEFLLMIDPARCFADLKELTYNIKLCDSTSIELRRLPRRLYVPQSNFKWQNSKLHKTKGGGRDIISFSEPLINKGETILLIHVIYSNTNGLNGQTLLLKKISNKWMQVCVVDAWVT